MQLKDHFRASFPDADANPALYDTWRAMLVIALNPHFKLETWQHILEKLDAGESYTFDRTYFEILERGQVAVKVATTRKVVALAALREHLRGVLASFAPENAA